MSTAIERIIIRCERLESDNKKLRAVNAELVKALTVLCDAKRPLDWSPSIGLVEAFANARAALASARGAV